MPDKHKYLLALESTFDDTGVAIIADGKPISDLRATGAGFYPPTGGVVPELAGHRHARLIPLLVKQALREAQVPFERLGAVAVAYGPGLITSLLAGTQAARLISWRFNIPLVGVNHLEGHIVSAFPKSLPPDFFPAICLLASGANTFLAKMTELGNYQLLGQTQDDAAGEALDKIARMLELGLPGGPAIARASALAQTRSDLPEVSLPRPMLYSSDLNFSFSGLKTAVLYQLKQRSDYSFKLSLACEAQKAVVEVLVAKTMLAAQAEKIKSIIATGGVLANELLRRALRQQVRKIGGKAYFPSPKLAGDNAVMIGLAGWKRWKNQDIIDWRCLKAQPKLKLTKS